MLWKTSLFNPMQYPTTTQSMGFCRLLTYTYTKTHMHITRYLYVLYVKRLLFQIDFYICEDHLLL